MLFTEEEKNRILAKVLKEFLNKYRSSTSADMQTFVISFKAAIECAEKKFSEVVFLDRNDWVNKHIK